MVSNLPINPAIPTTPADPGAALPDTLSQYLNATGQPVPVRRIVPLYRPLGMIEPRCVIWTPERVVVYHPAAIANLGFLLGLYPDIGYWRNLFPAPRSRVDSKAAAAWFVRECRKLGAWTPDPAKP